MLNHAAQTIANMMFTGKLLTFSASNIPTQNGLNLSKDCLYFRYLRMNR